uniref:Zn-dependent peptidase ImmA, M78 family n=1 Tax=Candidatus Kentrum sp. TC TaxID=2126339 RepID=A0A450Z674_9GAMM|nr:MAG: Zn-dependent peptidase ImmA, M78 family [Candidatus Kentron sp. TC]VFK49569.1 MAG: Zn-dependent peptidase ImmA, M78 family [Candidatus Kentron sp. TC]VFK65188.1 MAG: Zn-dependent peptidase ImmA, M78 family [Candidatus Kentron sp. TC]
MNKFLQYSGLPAKDLLETLEEEFQEFSITAPIDVEKIVRLLDVKLDEALDFDNLTTAGSVSIKRGRAVIWVNPTENTYIPRMRFTIAHEIGHLILHIDPEIGIREFIDTKKTLNRKDSYWDSKEYEANNFAAQLLMPIDLINMHGDEIISSYVSDTGKERMPVTEFIREMANLFLVSEPAMKYRLKNIGAIK